MLIFFLRLLFDKDSYPFWPPQSHLVLCQRLYLLNLFSHLRLKSWWEYAILRYMSHTNYYEIIVYSCSYPRSPRKVGEACCSCKRHSPTLCCVYGVVCKNGNAWLSMDIPEKIKLYMSIMKVRKLFPSKTTFVRTLLLFLQRYMWLSCRGWWSLLELQRHPHFVYGVVCKNGNAWLCVDIPKHVNLCTCQLWK